MERHHIDAREEIQHHSGRGPFIHSFSSQLETLNHQNKSETIKAVTLIEFFNNFTLSFPDKYLKLILWHVTQGTMQGYLSID